MQAQLSQFDTTSELRLIQSVSNTIQDSSDPLRQANSFITSFGIGPIADAGDARVVALAMAEAAYKQPTASTEDLIKYVENRYNKLVAKMPYGHVQLAIKLRPLKDGESETQIVSDKAAKAKAIYDEFIGKVSKNQIVKKIAEQLGITTGNASYYCYRVFSKES